MESSKIQELLNRYWQAETSVEEEAQLREYFSKPDLPEEWRETAGLFRYLNANKKKELTDLSFNDSVISNVQAVRKGKIALFVTHSLRIAAGIAVLALAVWFIRVEVNKTTGVAAGDFPDSHSDPKLAFEETKKALMIISKSFDAAENEARKINIFNEAQEEIQKEPNVSNDL